MGLRALHRFTFSALLLIYNKAIVDEDHFAFPYPLFGTTFQMPIQFALAATFRCVCRDTCCVLRLAKVCPFSLCPLRYGWPKKFKPQRNPSPRDYL